MAYSWLSHCKRYLELLEGEKRFLRNYKVQLLPTRKMCLLQRVLLAGPVLQALLSLFMSVSVNVTKVRHSWCMSTVFLAWRAMLSQC